MSIDLEKIKKAKGRTYINVEDCPIPICVDDYITYKEIEKEFGISLITLFKALKNGFYYFGNGGIVHTSNKENYIFLSAKSCLPNQMCIEVDFGDLETMYFYFQDYGKKQNGGWALTREEIEND